MQPLRKIVWSILQFSRSVMSNSFATPWTAAHQDSLSITNSGSLLKLKSNELVIPSNHFILYRPLLPPSVFPSIRVFSNESVLCIRWSKYWSIGQSIGTVVLEKTLDSPLDCREIQHAHSKGDQSWKDWCWNWNSNTLASSCEELTHWERP